MRNVFYFSAHLCCFVSCISARVSATYLRSFTRHECKTYRDYCLLTASFLSRLHETIFTSLRSRINYDPAFYPKCIHSPHCVHSFHSIHPNIIHSSHRIDSPLSILTSPAFIRNTPSSPSANSASANSPSANKAPHIMSLFSPLHSHPQTPVFFSHQPSLHRSPQRCSCTIALDITRAPRSPPSAQRIIPPHMDSEPQFGASQTQRRDVERPSIVEWRLAYRATSMSEYKKQPMRCPRLRFHWDCCVVRHECIGQRGRTKSLPLPVFRAMHRA